MDHAPMSTSTRWQLASRWRQAGTPVREATFKPEGADPAVKASPDLGVGLDVVGGASPVFYNILATANFAPKTLRALSHASDRQSAPGVTFALNSVHALYTPRGGLLLASRAPAHGSKGAHSAEDQAVSLAMLRTCFSERYGNHIPRMFQDLLEDVGQAFANAAIRGHGQSSAAGCARSSERTCGRGTSETSGFHDGDREQCGEGRRDTRGGVDGRLAPVFHVTEFNVMKGQYPESWQDFAGYLLPGGVASACGDEPWMEELLSEVKGLRKSGRPVLGFCLGHQVMAQALGGLVRPRAGPRRHYALQESQLLPPPAGSVAADMVSAAVEAAQGRKDRDARHVSKTAGSGVPPVKLLYHHNDEVVRLPPGAVNIATSRHCAIHGMAMAAEAEGAAPERPNVLTFQAHPEFNYEYGRRVMDVILDGDVEAGRLTHEKARRLKEQVSAWDHKEFPLAVELIRQLFDPIVVQRNGGLESSGQPET